MLRRFRRSLPLVAALSVVAGLVAAAGAITGTTDNMTLVCPSSVVAGFPINGYVTGGVAPRMVSAMNGPMQMPGSPRCGPQDPLYFSFATFEPDQGSVAFVSATEAGGQVANKSVAIQ